MGSDGEGFLYPTVHKDSCIDCGLCERACPIINAETGEPFEQRGYIVQANDRELLLDSTSGGAFTLMAMQVLDCGGVVYGVGFDENGLPAHKSATCVEDLAEMRGSKYAQSDPVDAYSEIRERIDNGEYVLYTGTPCQAEGLLRFLGRKPDNLTVVDLVCYAVSSPLVFARYKQYVGKSGFVRFRDKRPYGYQYSQTTVTNKAGDVEYSAGVESDPCFRAFLGRLSVRPSCYECAFKKRFRITDATIWDCYNARQFDKTFDDNLGASSVLSHTERGNELVAGMEGQATIKRIAPDELVAEEKAIYESVIIPAQRKDFFEDVRIIEDDADLFEKWFPINTKIVLERTCRRLLAKTGLLGTIKSGVKGLLA